MANVTLTTDYGCSDFYTAALKITITQRLPDVILYDISHDIEKFNISSAAYQVKSSLKFFPENTIHCIDVLSIPSPYLLMIYQNQYIISADNGILSLILDGDKPRQLFRIKTENIIKLNSFPALDIFPIMIDYISNSKDLNQITEPTTQLYLSQTLKAVVHSKMIRASIIHIDSYENAIINLTKNEFEEIAAGRNFNIRVRRTVEARNIDEHYSDVMQGEIVAFFNVSGFLEIAMNQGNMVGINNLNIGDVVQIDFT
jgi:S-adenosylmethionine hydrolase